MSDFFSVYGAQPVRGPATPTAPTRFSDVSFEPEYERNFLERVFAPFEAPQQGLFALTQGVASDGFQPMDLMDSLGHAARYFNPWSNEKPIEADEIRRTFLGEQAEQAGWAKFGTNLAISLLYDPLLFTGLTKGLAKLGTGGAGVARAINLVANPAEELISATKFVAKDVIGAQIHRLGREVMGPTKWDFWSTRIAQYTTNRFAGVPEELVQKLGRFEQDVTRWRMEGFAVMKKAEKLRGPRAQELLAEALETEAVYLNRAGRTLEPAQELAADAFTKKLAAEGISEDLFYSVYDRARRLDDEIGKGLYGAGLIDATDMETYQGTHLRRIFAAFEKPLDYIDRMEALIVSKPDLAKDVTRVSFKALKQNLDQFADEVAGAGFRAVRPTDRAGRAAFRGTVNASPYFNPQARNAFDTETFSKDLIDWLGQNPDKTASDVFEHVQTNMLGGIEMDGKFWEKIGNHLSGAEYTQLGLESYRNKLLDMAHGHGTTWRAIQERAEIVSKRENIRPEIADALGEILTAAPRVASEAADAGRLLETRKFLDDLAGVRRIGPEAGELIERAKSIITRGDKLPDQLMTDIERAVGRPLKPTEIAELGAGSIIEQVDNTISSATRTAKHTMQVPANPTYGEMAGRYVEPGTYLTLRRLEGVGDVANPTTNMANKTMDLIRDATGHFKVMKVIMDPTAQFRNMLGNMVLMDLQGTNPLRVDKLIKSGREIQRFMTTGDLGPYMKLAEEAGLSLFQHTFSRQELIDFAQTISKAPVDRRSWQGFFTGVFEAMNGVYRGTAQAGMKAFEFSEQTFKLDVFIDQYEKLASGVARAGRTLTPELRVDLAKQAGALAEQALFNYADVPYLVDFARKYGVVPFATFPFKAVPYVAETLHRNPHRVLKYHRTVEEANESGPWSPAEGPEGVAREVAALPRHLRDNLVLRLPGADAAGRAQYIDLAYFLPWYVLQDLKEQAGDPIASFFGSGAAGTPATEGLRGGMLTPPAMALIDALRRNEDSLGRPIVQQGMSSGEAALQWGKFLTEFWLPPSALGGSRSDAVGRALQAAARTDAEPQDWQENLGRALRLGANQDRVLPAPGMLPQGQAQVSSDPILGSILGLLTGGTSASDPTQARQQEVAAFRGSATDVARQMASIRSSPSLSVEEKRKRIARLRAQLMEMQEETRSTLGRM